MPTSNKHVRPSEAAQRKLTAIIKKANAGDADALAALRDWLNANPQVWGQLGDLNRVAEAAWIKLISNGDTLTAESLRRQLDQVKEDLNGEEPSAVEKMLGDAVTATWLETKYLEASMADGTGGSKTQAGMFLKRLESAQKRHLAAIRSLVQTRKLLPSSRSVPELRVFRSETG